MTLVTRIINQIERGCMRRKTSICQLLIASKNVYCKGGGGGGGGGSGRASTTKIGKLGTILTNKNSDALGIPNTAISRVIALAKYTSKEDANKLIQDRNLFAHLEAAASVKNQGQLGASFADAADKAALAMYKKVSLKTKKEIVDPSKSGSYSSEMLKRYANGVANGQTKAGQFIASDLLRIRQQSEQRLQKKDQARSRKSNKTHNSKTIIEDALGDLF